MARVPSVSVVMAVFNGRQTLPLAIHSLQLQTLEDWELILVDDCSNDGSGEWVIQLGDPRIRMVRNANNLGLAVSLNRGLDLATAPYVARLDCDDVCFPRRLQLQISYLQAHPEVDLVGCWALEFGAERRPMSVAAPQSEHQSIVSALRIGGTPMYHPSWCGRADWFRRHRYNPRFLKAQDLELLVRAVAESRYANVPEILIGYRRECYGLGKRLLTRHYVMRAYFMHLACKGEFLAFIYSAGVSLGRIVFDLLRALIGPMRNPGSRVMDLKNRPAVKESLAEWDALLRRIDHF
jgi:glycosyltransferase involved in cell wall biosynthesis